MTPSLTLLPLVRIEAVSELVMVGEALCSKVISSLDFGCQNYEDFFICRRWRTIRCPHRCPHCEMDSIDPAGTPLIPSATLPLAHRLW